MARDGEVKFIRKNGRVIPIRAKKGTEGKNKLVKRSESQESRRKSYAKAGAAIGAGITLATGIFTRAHLVKKIAKGAKKMGTPVRNMGGWKSNLGFALGLTGASAASGLATANIGSALSYKVNDKSSENSKAKTSLYALGAIIGANVAVARMGRKIRATKGRWVKAGSGGSNMGIFGIINDSGADDAPVLNKLKRTMREAGVSGVKPIVREGAPSHAGIVDKQVTLGSSGRSVMLHEVAHAKTMENKFKRGLFLGGGGSYIGKLVPELDAERVALQTLKTSRQRKAYVRERLTGGLNTYLTAAAAEGLGVTAGAYALFGENEDKKKRGKRK